MELTFFTTFVYLFSSQLFYFIGNIHWLGFLLLSFGFEFRLNHRWEPIFFLKMQENLSWYIWAHIHWFHLSLLRLYNEQTLLKSCSWCAQLGIHIELYRIRWRHIDGLQTKGVNTHSITLATCKSQVKSLVKLTIMSCVSAVLPENMTWTQKIREAYLIRDLTYKQLTSLRWVHSLLLGHLKRVSKLCVFIESKAASATVPNKLCYQIFDVYFDSFFKYLYKKSAFLSWN